MMKWSRAIYPLMSLTLAIGLGYLVGEWKNKENKFIPILKTYQVAPERAQEAESVFRSLFADDASLSVKAFGNGTLVVRIPQYFEKGVDDILQGFQEAYLKQDKKVKMDYWLVRGFQADTTQDSPKDLAQMKEALESITAVDGPMNFNLVEHLSSQSALGSTVKLNGMVSRVRNTLTQDSGELGMSLKYRTDFGEIETNTKIVDGQFMVVGQNGVTRRELKRARGGRFALTEGVEGTDRLYYIIRGTVIE